MSDTNFLWEHAQKNNDYNHSNENNQEQEVAEEENYQVTAQYEQERFTDEYSEYFEDDENKADRYIQVHTTITKILQINHTDLFRMVKQNQINKTNNLGFNTNSNSTYQIFKYPVH